MDVNDYCYIYCGKKNYNYMYHDLTHHEKNSMIIFLFLNQKANFCL